jgi:hypothetical protein
MELDIPDVFTEKRHLGVGGRRLWQLAGAVGLLALVAAAALGLSGTDHGRGFYFAYLVNFGWVLSLALGALFFVVLQHLTRAGWSVVVRRVAEAVAGTLPLVAVLLLPVLAGIHELYHWSHAEAVAADPLLQGKSSYLNVPFFVARCAVYFAAWWLTSRFYLARSVRQDASGDVGLTLAMQRRSAPAMLLFALTATFASIDLLMSLDPHWYSTIFGVYFFSGSVVSFISLLALAAWLLQRSGLMRHVVTIEHYHDLGKLMFAFTVFWAYIAFSQYMLYWYANIPEETGWFLRRQSGGWGWVGLLLIFGHFLVPFVLLLSRPPKRRPGVLAAVAAWILAMHWADLHWLVMPELRPNAPMPTPLELLLLVGVGGVWLAGVVFVMGRQSLVPERDPRLPESLSFENA